MFLESDIWVMLAGALCAMSCACVGCFLVLRKMSMMGDAISHSVLPGLAIAFLMTGDRSGPSMLLGAVVVGVLTAVLTQYIHKQGQVEESAAMGVVFTTLFALGLMIIVYFLDHSDIDASCVLYGSLEAAATWEFEWNGYIFKTKIIQLAIILALNVLVIFALFKELKISSFDPALATTLGVHAGKLHYVLIILVAITTVTAFDVVGSILVIAMLIIPAATAYLLTQRLGLMIIISMLLGALGSVLGQLSIIYLLPAWGLPDTFSSGMMTVMVTVFLILAILFSPKSGILFKLIRHLQLGKEIFMNRVLGALYRTEEEQPNFHHLEQIQKTYPVRFKWAIWLLKRNAMVVADGKQWRLTENGEVYARKLVRSHRLWENYIFTNMNVPVDHLHYQAASLEHVTDESLLEQLAETTSLEHDPHGREIPQKKSKD
ncbi:MAG: metal ABC transporter permease [Lentisphaeria bacterium]|nr:metal ABC transporter permease [Lentisphaeria bacterium]